ncbi:MAG: NUDIX hydrolase [Bacteroidales bacterium]
MILNRENLKIAIAEGLPGTEVQNQMASSDRLVKGFPRMPRADSKEAAVLIILYNSGGSIFTVFIQRPDNSGVHGGQVSFPGGRKDATDKSHKHTALREASEETGINPEDVEIIGTLTPLYIPVSNFNVIPFVGWMDKRPLFSPHRSEVAYLIEADLGVFLEGLLIKKGFFEVRGERIEIRYFDYMGNVIWGATAMILNELLAVIKRSGLRVRE